MPFSSPSRSRNDNGLEAARRQRLQRAGLHGELRGGEPTGAFVAIEMAVLVLVSTLAMVSVIVTTCSPAEARAITLDFRGDVARHQKSDAPEKRVTAPPLRDAGRPGAVPAAAK